MRTLTKFTTTLFLALASFSYTAQASLIFELDTNFSNATTPLGNAPWLRATFETQNATTVRLTMDSLLQDSSEFVDGGQGWFFNLNPIFDAANLGFNQVSFSGISAAGAGGVVINTGIDFTNADGGGLYDIQFDLVGAPPADRFGMGSQLVYDITLAGGLTELDFDFSSSPQGGNGIWKSAAHVQGITDANGRPELSSYIGADSGIICNDPDGCDGGGPPTEVPEPSVLFLLGSALLALSLRKKTY